MTEEKEIEEKPIGRVLVRMQAMYSYMLASSETVNTRDYFRFDVPTNTPTAQIWRGFIREVAEALAIPRYSVDQALGRLVSLEAIRQISRGTHGNPSVYLLMEAPTAETYDALQERSATTGRYKPATPLQRAQDSVNRLAKRVAELEQRLERIELVQKNDALRAAIRRDGDSVTDQG